MDHPWHPRGSARRGLITLDPPWQPAKEGRDKKKDHFGSLSLWIRAAGGPGERKKKKIVEEKGRKMREDKDTQSPTTMAGCPK